MLTPSGWVQYNAVDFGNQKLRTATLRSTSAAGATIELRLDHAQGPLLAQLTVPKGGAWQAVKVPLAAVAPGRHTLFVALKRGAGAEIDWVSFE